MIVAGRKPLDAIAEMIAEAHRVLILGCGECVTVCSAGGQKEVELLCSELQLHQSAIPTREFIKHTVQRQCDREFLEPILQLARDVDLVISMACGAGVQLCAELMFPVPVKPALNTQFMGITQEVGSWVERCIGCGDCRLHVFAGICPMTRCAKSLLNGPCGGSMNGFCEINKDQECAWQLIYDRAAQLGNLEALAALVAPTDWSKGREGGVRSIVRQDLIK